MKNYILFFDIAGMVAGGPIYGANKAHYMEKQGYNVIVFSSREGDIYIRPLLKYKDNCYTFIKENPFVLPKNVKKRFVDVLASKVPDAEETVIETGTDYTAYWGECLAERLRAKHVVILTDEKNDRINERNYPFYKFKFLRNELAGIARDALDGIFSKYGDINKNNCIPLSCFCSNSVANTDYSVFKNVKKADFNVGSIGRLDKPVVPVILEGVKRFAENHKDKKINLFMFGGAEERCVDRVKEKVSSIDNVELYVSGYVWPIPKKDVTNCDMFVSTMGSALSSAKAGVPTLRMDAFTDKPLKLIDEIDGGFYDSDGTGREVKDYLEQVLIKKEYPVLSPVKDGYDEETIDKRFSYHMDFIDASDKKKEYFDFGKIKLTAKQRIKKILIKIFGYGFFIKHFKRGE